MCWPSSPGRARTRGSWSWRQEQNFSKLGLCPQVARSQRSNPRFKHTLPPGLPGRSSSLGSWPKWLRSPNCGSTGQERSQQRRQVQSPKKSWTLLETAEHLLVCCSDYSEIQTQSLTSHEIWSTSLHVPELWSPWCQTLAQCLTHNKWGQSLICWGNGASPFLGGSWKASAFCPQ